MFPRRRGRHRRVVSLELLDQLARLDGEEGGRGRPAARRRLRAAARVDHVGPVLRVDAVPAHGRELPPLGHEHHDEGDGGAADEAARHREISPHGLEEVAWRKFNSPVRDLGMRFGISIRELGLNAEDCPHSKVETYFEHLKIENRDAN